MGLQKILMEFTSSELFNFYKEKCTKEMAEERLAFMKKVLPNCQKIGMKYILMPVLIGPSLELVANLKSKENMDQVLDFLRRSLEIAEDCGIKFALETALNAKESFELLEQLNSSSFVLCYDTGNSAFFSHDIFCLEVFYFIFPLQHSTQITIRNNSFDQIIFINHNSHA